MRTQVMSRKVSSTKMIAEAGVMIALAQVLSMITLFKMPQGGSITPASMVPIMIFALRWGMGPGTLAGISYGFLQMIFGGFVATPLQGALDYPIAFAMLGITGLASKTFLDSGKNLTKKLYIKLGMVSFIAILMRLICHVLSGVIFFSEYAGDSNPWIYSIGYNGSFLMVEFIISVVAIGLLLKPISKIK